MIEATPAVAGESQAESWRQLLRGLWWSGLRTGEAVKLRWEPTPGGCWVVLDGRRSVIMFDGDAQKNGQAKPTPMAPEFVTFLESLPRESEFVFNPIGRRGKVMHHKDRIEDRIGEIGKAARVVTNPATGKTATGHDLRRSFGCRWANRLKPQRLRALMRHSSIQTTLEFYVDMDAEEESAALWEALPQQHSQQHSAGEGKAKTSQTLV